MPTVTPLAPQAAGRGQVTGGRHDTNQTLTDAPHWPAATEIHSQRVCLLLLLLLLLCSAPTLPAVEQDDQQHKAGHCKLRLPGWEAGQHGSTNGRAQGLFGPIKKQGSKAGQDVSQEQCGIGLLLTKCVSVSVNNRGRGKTGDACTGDCCTMPEGPLSWHASWLAEGDMVNLALAASRIPLHHTAAAPVYCKLLRWPPSTVCALALLCSWLEIIAH